MRCFAYIGLPADREVFLQAESLHQDGERRWKLQARKCRRGGVVQRLASKKPGDVENHVAQQHQEDEAGKSAWARSHRASEIWVCGNFMPGAVSSN